MMKLLGLVALVSVVIAATVVITRYSDDILAAFTSWTDSSAQVPGLIPFQAVLTDSTGALVDDGDYTVTSAFYSATAGGTPLCPAGAVPGLLPVCRHAGESEPLVRANGLYSVHRGYEAIWPWSGRGFWST